MTKCFTLAAACALAFVLYAQNEGSSVLQGIVRDSNGKPIASATVQLKSTGPNFTAQTDAQGSYRFGKLLAGEYRLHVNEAESGEADAGPFRLGQQDTKTIDLALALPAKAQFFDEPTFIVAGVTDPSQRGGHGSDPVLRSAETLAKETSALRTGAAANTNPLEAVRAYQRDAERDPSEVNLFNWGTELLTHRAADQALEVFAKGNRLFPRSTRMLLGLAVANYSRGSYDQAAPRFFEAADLNPRDPTPYLFLGKLSSGAIRDLDGYAQRMERFARLHPENGWANYYYAATLISSTPSKAQALLEKAVRLDHHLGAAFLLLGIVFAEQNDLPKAIGAFQSAIDAASPMEEAHYRLAQAYRKSGDPAKAQREIDLFQQLSQQSAQQVERERSEIQQFVFELR